MRVSCVRSLLKGIYSRFHTHNYMCGRRRAAVVWIGGKIYAHQAFTHTRYEASLAIRSVGCGRTRAVNTFFA